MISTSIKSFLLLLSTLLIYFNAQSQTFEHPEVEALYKNSIEQQSKRNYNEAIMLLAQAIRMEPNSVLLRRDLAYTYFLAGDKEKAKEIIDPVINSEVADAPTYQIASAIEASLGNRTKAGRIINNGIKKYPTSGLLYQAKGNLHSGNEKEFKDAVLAYTKGIDTEPSFAGNYYFLAKSLLTTQPEWTIVLGEMYVNMEDGTPRAIEMRKIILNAYRNLLMPSESDRLPSFNARQNNNGSNEFMTIYKQLIFNNASVFSDGINTENLIMLNVRVNLDWFRNFALFHSSTLLAYHNKLIHAGHFDAYNQWLFGAADNSQNFSSWIKMNPEAYTAFENWKRANPYFPSAADPKPI